MQLSAPRLLFLVFTFCFLQTQSSPPFLSFLFIFFLAFISVSSFFFFCSLSLSVSFSCVFFFSFFLWLMGLTRWGEVEVPCSSRAISVFGSASLFSWSPLVWFSHLLFIGLDFWWFICRRLFPFRMRISVAWGVGVLPGLGHQQSRHGWTVGGGFWPGLWLCIWRGSMIGLGHLVDHIGPRLLRLSRPSWVAFWIFFLTGSRF